jgi:hypothetical protein
MPSPHFATVSSPNSAQAAKMAGSADFEHEKSPQSVNELRSLSIPSKHVTIESSFGIFAQCVRISGSADFEHAKSAQSV